MASVGGCSARSAGPSQPSQSGWFDADTDRVLLKHRGELRPGVTLRAQRSDAPPHGPHFRVRAQCIRHGAFRSFVEFGAGRFGPRFELFVRLHDR